MRNPTTMGSGHEPSNASALSLQECLPHRGMLTKILHSVPLAVFWKNRAGIYLGCNGVFADWAGFQKPEQVIGKTDADLPWSKEQAEAFLRAERKVIDGNKPMRHLSQPLHRADGQSCWIDVSLVPLTNNKNQVEAILGIYDDVTARKQSEERFYKAFHASPSPVAISRIADKKILDVNEAFERYLGFSRKEALNNTTIRLGIWVDLAQCDNVSKKILSEGRIRNEECRFRAKDGSLRIALLSSEAIDINGVMCMLSVAADITDRRQVEEQQRILASIVARTDEMVSWADSEGQIVYLNEAGCRLFGLESNAYANQDLYAFAPKGTREKLEQEIIPKNMRGEAWEGELQCKNLKTGVIRDLHAMIFPVCDSSPEKKLLLANVSVDITERKRAEKLLKLNAERSAVLLKLNQMIDASLEELTSFVLEEAVRLTQSKLGYIAFVSEDQSNMTMQAWSQEAMAKCRIAAPQFHYPVAQAGLWGEAVRQRKPIITNDFDAPNPLRKGLPEGHVAVSRHMNIPVIVGNDVVLVAGVGNKEENYDETDVQQLTLLMEGLWRLVERRRSEQELAIYRDHLEDIVARRTAELEDSRKQALALMQEANEQKRRTEDALTALQRSEEQLRRSEAELRLSNEHLAHAQAIAHVGHWTWDLATDRVEASEEYHRIRGVTSNSIASFQEMLQTVHPEDRERVEQAASATSKGLMPYNIEYRIVMPDQTIKYVRATGESTCDSQGKPEKVFGATIDITDSKMAEIRLQEAILAVKAANRAKSVFLANMSHELRTPLTAVLGFAQLLQDTSSLNDMQREYIDIINRSGAHLLSLINDVLDMSKIESGQLAVRETVFDLHAMLLDIEEMMRIRADAKNLTFNIECSPNLPHFLRTDEKKLKQIIINLVGNAIKFTNKGGVILRVHTESAGSALCCDVEDSGPGIPADYMPKLFERFIQGEEDQEGVGLGLYISRKLVELMGGHISVSSQQGNGSCFSFDIQCQPAVVAESQYPSVRRRVVGLAPGQAKPRILVVEDKSDTRLFIVKLLQAAGFDVDEAENGQEAIDQFAARPANLILMDMRMPVMDGYQATQNIKATDRGRKTPIIAITASAFDEDRQKSIASGVDDYLGKPIQVDELYEIIRNHLGLTYEYAQRRSSQPSPRLSRSAASQKLARLPKDILEKLRSSLVKLDYDELKSLIQQAKQHDSELADYMLQLANGFEVAMLAELLHTGSAAE